MLRRRRAFIGSECGLRRPRLFAFNQNRPNGSGRPQPRTNSLHPPRSLNGIRNEKVDVTFQWRRTIPKLTSIKVFVSNIFYLQDLKILDKPSLEKVSVLLLLNVSLKVLKSFIFIFYFVSCGNKRNHYSASISRSADNRVGWIDVIFEREKKVSDSLKIEKI